MTFWIGLKWYIHLFNILFKQKKYGGIKISDSNTLCINNKFYL